MPQSNYILFDPPSFKGLLPLAYTRSIADFRIGIFTIKEKWEFHLDKTVGILCRAVLQPLYELESKAEGPYIYVNSCVLPDRELVDEIMELQLGECLFDDDVCIAACTNDHFLGLEELYGVLKLSPSKQAGARVTCLRHNWDVFHHNGAQIINDIEHIAISGNGDSLSDVLSVQHGDRIYVEESAKVECAILNASKGPIYIGKHALVMDGAIIRGPVSIGDHAVIKAGAKIYGDTTIGPYCKVGGEVSNSVLFGYSNKGHDGYLGNSVLGEWCNLGADTNTSNLKNNYTTVKTWDYEPERELDSGLQFCGLIMGDHSKSGINTMFNTGSVVGVASNIFGSGFPAKFVPSFSWGGNNGMTEFRMDKVFEMAERMMERRKVALTDVHKAILKAVHEESSHLRHRQRED